MESRALRVLFDRHWGGGRWKTEFATPGDDVAYAVAAGAMFHDVTVSHDEAVEWLLRARDRANLADIVGGFLASLGTRRLAPRSALGSYAFAKNFPDHPWAGPGALCAVCGLPEGSRRQDLNVLSFERHKWGGVRHDHPVYAAFDLERFEREDKPRPRAEDAEAFEAVLGAIRALAPDARPRTVEQALTGLLPSNKSEREVLVHILGYCGILESPAHPGYFAGFAPYAERPLPPVHRIDWRYPVCWWRGRHGLNLEALGFYFGTAMGETPSTPSGTDMAR